MRPMEQRARPAAASAFEWRRLFLAPRLTTLCRIWAVLLFLPSSKAQTDDDPARVLLHVRQNVVATIQRLPKYVCTLTVDRTRYEPSNPEFGAESKRGPRSCDEGTADARRGTWKRYPSSSDRLRLDVAVNHESAVENEMYSWAGEDRFSDRDLFDLVPQGAISSGSFTSMLTSIFGNDTATFSYHGDNKVSGKLFSEFGFRIPQEKSHYLYIFGEAKQRVPMAYDGTFLVDLEKSDLMRLNLRTGQLPPQTGSCEVSQSLNYSRVQLNDSEFLLPSDIRVVSIHTDGSVAENHMQFSACHEFHSDISVRYGTDGPREASTPEPAAAPTTSVPSLPPGLPFKVLFTDRIDTATAAAGDVIHGRLKTAIRDTSEKVLVPEGTDVAGRILSITHYFHPERTFMSDRRNSDTLAPSLVLHVRLESLAVAGSPQPLKATFDSGLRRFVKMTGPFTVRVDIGSAEELHSRLKESEIGSFEFFDRDPKLVVKPPLESNWVTAGP
jgi:hypothetical protein